jgi:HEAT repeat protein
MQMIQSFFGSALMALFLLQGPSLDSASPKERQAAIEQLAVLGNSQGIPALADAYKKEPKADLRAEIVAGLARIHDKAAISPIAEALHTDIDKDVRLQAIDALLRLYIPADENGPIRTIFSKVKSVFFYPERPIISPEVVVDSPATQALAESAQKDFTDEVRVEAARALGSLKAKDQVPALIAILEDPKNREHEQVRLEVIRTLGTIRDATAGPALQKALQDRDRDISSEAALSLGLVAYNDAGPALEALFRTSSDRMVKRKSLEGLALMRNAGSAPLFESLLGHSDDYYRELAAEGLARLHHDPQLLKDRYALEKKPNVRNALAFALVEAGQDDYINDLANALDSRQDYQVHVYLVEMGKFDGKLQELYRYLKSTNPKIRAKMVNVIGEIADPSSRDQIQPLTNDPNVEVAREAVAALRKMTRQPGLH